MFSTSKRYCGDVSKHGRNGGRVGRLSDRRHGFTLVELLAVIAIIGTLVGLLLPAVQAARESARLNTCSSNIRQIALGLANFESAQGRFPSASEERNGELNASALVYILPFIEQQELYAAYDLKQSFVKSPNTTVGGRRIQNFLCPSYTGPVVGSFYGPYITTGAVAYPSLSATCYNGVYGWGTSATYEILFRSNLDSRRGMFYIASRTRTKDVTDGLSKTLMFGEFRPNFLGVAYGNPGGIRPSSSSMYNGVGPSTLTVNDRWGGPWSGGVWLDHGGSVKGMNTGPNQPGAPHASGAAYDWARLPFSSEHRGGVTMAYGDGAVVFVTDNVDINVWRNLSTVAGAETDVNL